MRSVRFEDPLKIIFFHVFYRLKKIAVKPSGPGNKFPSSNLDFTLRRDNKIASAHCDSASASIARTFGAFSTSFPAFFLSHLHFFPLLVLLSTFFPEDFSPFYRRDWHSCASQGEAAASSFPSTLSSTIRCDGENAGLRPVRMRISSA